MTFAHPNTGLLAPASLVAPARAPAAAADAGESLLAPLRWRYAVKKFDAARKIPSLVWGALEESLTLSPSSGGLQPWKFFVVDDPALRERLRAASHGQSQVTDADRFVVLAAKQDFSMADVDRFAARVAEVRQVPVESLAGLKGMLQGIVSRPEAARAAWAANQVYIALGFFLSTAASLGVDTCPMEGLDKAQYDRILRLGEKGYATVVACAAGYRSEEDKYGKLPKVRFPRGEVVEHL